MRIEEIMMQDIEQKVFISSPSDVTNDRQQVTKALLNLNKDIQNKYGVFLIPRSFENIFPTHGTRPQAVINSQLLSTCDLAIALFWHRYGSNTGKFPSGTIEEISSFIDAGKQVFLYFCHRKIDPYKIDLKQFEEARKFKRKYSGIYKSYATSKDLVNTIEGDMEAYFKSISQSQKSVEQEKIFIQLNLKTGSFIESSRISSLTDNGSHDFTVTFDGKIDERLPIQILGYPRNANYNIVNRTKNSVRILFDAPYPDLVTIIIDNL